MPISEPAIIDAEFEDFPNPVPPSKAQSVYDTIRAVAHDVSKGLEQLGAAETAAKIQVTSAIVDDTKRDLTVAKNALQRAYDRMEKAGLIKIGKRDLPR